MQDVDLHPSCPGDRDHGPAPDLHRPIDHDTDDRPADHHTDDRPVEHHAEHHADDGPVEHDPDDRPFEHDAEHRGAHHRPAHHDTFALVFIGDTHHRRSPVTLR